MIVRINGLPANWRLRQYRDANRLLIHALPAKVETVLHPTLKNKISGERIVEKVNDAPLVEGLLVESPVGLPQVIMHSPDLNESRTGRASGDKRWAVEPTNVSRYFILECFA